QCFFILFFDERHTLKIFNSLILCAFGACEATTRSQKEHRRQFADKEGGRIGKRKTRACAPC
ncbi:hypothetical protein QML34_29055, partial [Klebsiella pneumoniae]|uniref:hypothetical protein n=1 Tax=Klebsiella pneumoniae TaxID=573 RepID=UPI003A7F960C